MAVLSTGLRGGLMERTRRRARRARFGMAFELMAEGEATEDDTASAGNGEWGCAYDEDICTHGCVGVGERVGSDAVGTTSAAPREGEIEDTDDGATSGIAFNATTGVVAAVVAKGTSGATFDEAALEPFLLTTSACSEATCFESLASS